MKKLFFLFAAMMMAAVVMAQTPTVSASSVTLKYCLTTYGAVEISTVRAKLPVSKDGFSFNDFGVYVRKLTNVRGCDSVVTYTISRNVEGLLPGRFRVNAQGHEVQFSKGNLMFRAYNGTTYPNSGSLSHRTANGTTFGVWKFGEQQYSACGDTYLNSNPSLTRTDWRDLFSHASSGYDDNVSQAWDYCNANSAPASVAGTNWDWGVFNAIEGGGNQPGFWRSLTQTEFDYLISYCQSQGKYGWGNINGVNGVFLLPVNWVKPNGCNFTANSGSNSYTLAQWGLMEAAGAVFIVLRSYYASGSFRDETDETMIRVADKIYNFDFTKNPILVNWSGTRKDGGHVRLVRDVD